MAKHANFVNLLAWNYGAHANNVILNAWGEPKKNRTGKEYLFNVGEKKENATISHRSFVFGSVRVHDARLHASI